MWHTTKRVEFAYDENNKPINITLNEVRFKWENAYELVMGHPADPNWTWITLGAGQILINEPIDSVCEQIDKSKSEARQRAYGDHLKQMMPQLKIQNEMLGVLKDHHGNDDE